MLLVDFFLRLAKILAEIPQAPEKLSVGPYRLLHEEDYFSLMLLGMLMPAPDARRCLCCASHLLRVKE